MSVRDIIRRTDAKMQRGKEGLEKCLEELQTYCRIRCGRYMMVSGCSGCSVKERKDAIIERMRETKRILVFEGREEKVI
jgi:hypothetical protein